MQEKPKFQPLNFLLSTLKCYCQINKTKDTLVPSAARDFRAQGKDCNLISLKLAIKILIAMTNC